MLATASSPAASLTRPPHAHAARAQFVLLVVACLLAWLPFLGNGFIWDDDLWVTDNPTLRSAQGLWDIWFRLGSNPQYYPLVHTVFWLEYHAWGLAPLGFHLVNLLLHTVSVLLLWRLLARLGVPGAVFGALLFAVHPMQVESVAWITELKNVLSGLFYLLAATAFLRFKGVGAAAPAAHRGRAYALALLCFLAALLSKTTACTLPAALLLALWWKRPRLALRDVLEVAPMFVLGAALGLVTVWMERHAVGAKGSDWDFSFLERVVIAGRIAWFYLGKLAWPHPMTFIYPRWTIDAHAVWQMLCPATLVAALVALVIARGRIGRGPATAALFYVGTLAPALGFFDVYPMRFSFVANHFAYLALVGPMALLGALVSLAFGRLAPARRTAGIGVVATWFAVLVALTWNQARDYADAPTLWNAVLRRNPDCWIAHRNLAQQAYRAGDLARAAQEFADVVRIAPHVRAAHYDYGTVLDRLGRTSEATAQYELELTAFADSPLAHVNLAGVCARSGDLAAAIGHLQRAVELEPGSPLFHFDLGLAYEQHGDPRRGAEQFERALDLGAGDAPVLEGYARVMSKLDRVGEAVATIARTVARQPENAAARKVLDALRRVEARQNANAPDAPAAVRH